ncbi:hypothetical protein IMZ48_27715, partial [Candidatus Bathyarchaeota archaeon]|nr:hypothetical protein [Candidatus Bathyarchaeota archaeon]
MQDQPTWAPSPTHPYHSHRTTPPREKRKRTLASTLRALTRTRRKPRPQRNLRISSPSHFRHVYSHSHQFSADAFSYV